MQEFILNIIKQNAVDVVWIIALFFFGKAILKLIVKRLAHVVDDGDDTHISKKEKRAETLGNVIVTTGNIVIYAVLLLMVFVSKYVIQLKSAGVVRYQLPCICNVYRFNAHTAP